MITAMQERKHSAANYLLEAKCALNMLRPMNIFSEEEMQKLLEITHELDRLYAKLITNDKPQA